jgi:hypothetical protein
MTSFNRRVLSEKSSTLAIMLERVVCKAREIVRPAKARDSQSLKLGGYPCDYQDTGDGDYDPGYPEAISYSPDELP